MADVRETLRAYRRESLGGRTEVDFLELVRRLEASAGREVGRSSAWQDEPVRFGQRPSLAYAESAVADIEERPLPLVYVNFFGLWGPNGPMPLELTSYLHQRSHNYGDAAGRRFADILNHRFLGLYYRAWAMVEQAVQFDRPDGGLVARVCSALAGDACSRTSLDRFTSARYCGLFGHAVKSRDGLETLLASAFRLPLRVRDGLDSCGRIPAENRLRLSCRGVAELGVTTQLGSVFRTRARRFAVEVGLVGFREAMCLLPGSRRYTRLAGLVACYLDRPCEWELRLRIRARTIPPVRLSGDFQLGRSMWLGPVRAPEATLTVRGWQ